MLGWLPQLTGIFPEAVALAVRMRPVPLKHGYGLIDEFGKSDSLLGTHPRELAQLLIYLGRSDSPGYVWGDRGRQLIDRLLQSDLSNEMEQGLKELKVKKGL